MDEVCLIPTHSQIQSRCVTGVSPRETIINTDPAAHISSPLRGLVLTIQISRPLLVERDNVLCIFLLLICLYVTLLRFQSQVMFLFTPSWTPNPILCFPYWTATRHGQRLKPRCRKGRNLYISHTEGHSKLRPSGLRNVSISGEFEFCRMPLWSGGQSSWPQIQRSQVRFPTLLDFLGSSGSGTGSTQPREDN
jgi:hypothetical protein